jgi:CRISPR-associated endonuclease/helicase Cas3
MSDFQSSVKVIMVEDIKPIASYEPIAHVTKDPSLTIQRTHTLFDHLKDVAKLAGRFASGFDGAAYAELAGRWHDLGKYSGDFQRMIRAETGFEAHIEIDMEGNARDHSTAGAVKAFGFASTTRDEALVSVAFAIAGHHAGLSNVDDLKSRLKTKEGMLAAVEAKSPPSEIVQFSPPAKPTFLLDQRSTTDRRKLDLEMWTRLLFSSLCDADFLDTEQFFRDAHAPRGESYDLAILRGRLQSHLDRMESNSPASNVNQVRREVRSACQSAGVMPPGIFSLTVPTGGGKTLAGMMFALEHAIAHGLRRVIVAIPFTSIIEQTAKIYRDVFGEDAVIEHHSALDPMRETPQNRLASENWDAPIIVTTNVQLLESMFASRTSSCRKLHNVAQSVVILDEAQSVPGKLLPAILDAFGFMSRHARMSLVVSTATQPAFHESATIPEGFTDVREICPLEMQLFERLRRVRAERLNAERETSYEELAAIVAANNNCLAIVHLRKDARQLCALVDMAVGDQNTVHLSALMTPEHRSRVLASIKEQRKRGEPVRVVSTQLVEAGVDVDFPVVYRAMAGLDSLAQAAGRCNREGKLDLGTLYVFNAPTKPPRGNPRVSADLTKLLWQQPEFDIFSAEAQRRFFVELYQRTNLAAGREIQEQRKKLNFREVSSAFELIENDWAAPLVIAHGRAANTIDEIRQLGPSRNRFRSLQPFIVSIPKTALKSGALTTAGDSLYVLEGPMLAAYDSRFGLQIDRLGTIDPDHLNL